MDKKKKKFSKVIRDSDREQFKFSIQYQLEVLRYLIQSKESILSINKVKSSYFSLLEHCLICESLLKCYKKYKKIPSEPVLLEHTQTMLNSKDYVSLTTKDDLNNLNVIIHDLYTNKLKDADILKQSLLKFIAYIEIKTLNESTDFSDYSEYQSYQQKLATIIRESKGTSINDDPILYMVDGTTNRQLQRRIDPEVVPTPFKQLNALTNAGGYPTGSVIVLLDKAKAKKTFTLVNVARGYLAMKKNVLYIDTENGSGQIMDRMIQSSLNKTKKELISGDYDKLEQKHMRKYRRIGSEFIVKRVTAMVSDTNTIRSIIQQIETEKNIKIHNLFIDYGGKLASISREKDDFERMNNVYIDIQNLALDLQLESVWTAHHITREGSKHKETKYEENDISGSIAIIRNVQTVLGLNSTADEEENNIQRIEIVVQRDGVPHGRALFNIDVERQRMKEFSIEARKAYDETQGRVVDDLINNKIKGKSRAKVGPNVDVAKANNKSGDI